MTMTACIHIMQAYYQHRTSQSDLETANVENVETTNAELQDKYRFKKKSSFKERETERKTESEGESKRASGRFRRAQASHSHHARAAGPRRGRAS